MTLSGNKLAGGNPERGRVDNDYYATPPEAVKMLLTAYSGVNGTVLEPCVGGGHIAQTIKDFYINKRNVVCLDIVDRGYPDTIVTDFLSWEPNRKFDSIVTNPPYSLALEFAEKGLSLLDDNGVMALFLKIQFLEGAKRREFFENTPPKYVYVFSKRMGVWREGKPLDPNGKPWATTMCHAWFVWEKGSKTEPIVRWL